MSSGRRMEVGSIFGWIQWRHELNWKEPVEFFTPKEQMEQKLGPQGFGGKGVGGLGEIGEVGVVEMEVEGGQGQLELYLDLEVRREHLGWNQSRQVLH